MQTLQTERVVKGYNGRPVVDGVDIGVSRGEIVGLLGPNGAGKTTTFAMMVGYVKPDGGGITPARGGITAPQWTPGAGWATGSLRRSRRFSAR